jgi:hypothetical protein
MPQNKIKRDALITGENQQPGFPGYRISGGRSGYDPLDTNREAAYMEGIFYRKLFTLKLRTQSVFHLSLMLIFGIILSILMSYPVYALFSGFLTIDQSIGSIIIVLLLLFIWGLIFLVGIFLLINFSINIYAIYGNGTSRMKPENKKNEVKKKKPKRRKDYR